MGQGKSFARLQTLREEIIDLGLYLETGGKKPRLDSNRRFLDFLWNTKNNAFSGMYLKNKDCEGLVRYLRQICDEAIRLRNSLSQQYENLVYRLVRKYSHKNQDFLDLVQEGFTGLLRAVDTFDVTYGVPFEAYAITWIRKYLSQLVMYNSEVIRVPESQVKIHRIKKSGASITSIVDFSENMGDVIDGTQNQEQKLIRTNTIGYLNECVDALKDDQRNIIRTRYFSESGKVESLEKVGRQCGYSRERTRQLEKGALQTLRKKMK
ncbi:MAG: sigma-70 family RNA polymerase sigma factor [Fibrobacter sp.]|nr:sigma-70 family RNA polymerase sigma factor [Fibrobacter sp.]